MAHALLTRSALWQSLMWRRAWSHHLFESSCGTSGGSNVGGREGGARNWPMMDTTSGGNRRLELFSFTGSSAPSWVDVGGSSLLGMGGGLSVSTDVRDRLDRERDRVRFMRLRRVSPPTPAWCGADSVAPWPRAVPVWSLAPRGRPAQAFQTPRCASLASSIKAGPMHSMACGDAANTSRQDSSASRCSARSPRKTRSRTASMP
jgi:hypothetical protein